LLPGLVAIASLLVSLVAIFRLTWTGRIPLHFAVEFAGQLFQFRAGPAEGFGLVAEHPFSGSFNSLAQLP
jgi:hypothetical protein